MSINIRAIKIMMETNIPGKKAFPLTKSVLYNPLLTSVETFQEYPYFTTDVKFPESYLNSLSYTKRLEFFFDKNTMEKILRTMNADFLKRKPVANQPIEIKTREQVAKENESATETTNKQMEIKSLREMIKTTNNAIEIEKTKNDSVKEQEKFNLYGDFINKKETGNTKPVVAKKDGIFYKNSSNSNQPFIKNDKPITSIDMYISEKKREFKVKTDEISDLLKDMTANTTVETIFQPNRRTEGQDTQTKPYMKTMQEMKELTKEYLTKIQRIYTEYGIDNADMNNKIEKFKKDIGKMTLAKAETAKKDIIGLNKAMADIFQDFSKDMYDKTTAEFIQNKSQIVAEYESKLDEEKKKIEEEIKNKNAKLDSAMQVKIAELDAKIKDLENKIQTNELATPEAMAKQKNAQDIFQAEAERLKTQSTNSEENIRWFKNT